MLGDGVAAVALSGTAVYVGGYFKSAAAVARNRLAAVDAASGQVTGWNPGSDSMVDALAGSGRTVYAGGTFTTIGGAKRNRVAALDTRTGRATAWNPGASGTVLTLAVSGSIVYAGGSFSTIGSASRHGLAALDAATGRLSAWDPEPNAPVHTLALSAPATTVYAGGTFTRIGDAARNRIAALDATTGRATAWNPNASGTVDALTVSGNIVYAGGRFGSIGACTSMSCRAHRAIAALDATTGVTTAWNPNPQTTNQTHPPTIDAIAATAATVFVDGDFARIGGANRLYVAALDATRGRATSWNPPIFMYGTFSMVVSGSSLYAGGDFGAAVFPIAP